MTQKVFRYLADSRPPTPCLVLDLDRVGENYGALRNALPLAKVYYAVKANPAMPILRRLVSLGASFDAASWPEIRDCLEAGADPLSISFGNTVKKADAIRMAHGAGVRMFAFDSLRELEKIAEGAPGSRVYCRVMVGNDGAEWPLSRKFGTTVEGTRDLMSRVAGMGLDPYGLSFHVGSQQTATRAHAAAIARVGALFIGLRDSGVNVRMLNMGGGFPVRYREDVPGIRDMGDAIMSAVTSTFGNGIPELLVEPGRFLVGDAGVLSSEVVLVSRKSDDEETRWVYLDIGRFGGLAETEGESIRYDIRTPRDGETDGPVIIAGPTCDSVDTMYQKSGYRLPMGLMDGDLVQLLSAGAYVTSYASQCFNGFAPPGEHYI